MKSIINLFVLISAVVIIIGCGSGKGVTDRTYNIEEGKNRVILGPIEDAIVKIYKINDREKPIFTTKTGKLGSFDVNGLNVDDDEMLIVSISGGKDVDADDDGKLDITPTPFKGKIYGFATKKDLENGKVNITIASELVYLNLKEVLPIEGEKKEDFNILNSDFSKIVQTYSSLLFNSKNKKEAYNKLLKFSPLSNDKKENLKFNYKKLNELVSLIHKEDISNNQSISRKVERITKIPSLNKEQILSLRDKVKVRVLLPKGTEIEEANNIDINSQNRKVFIEKNKNFEINIKVSNDEKVLFWRGCDIVTENKKKCIVNASYKDRVIMPFIVPKEPKLKQGITIRDISNAYIKYRNDTIIIPISNLDQNTTNTLQQIETGDILVHKIQPLIKKSNIFLKNIKQPLHFARVTSVNSNQNSYIIKVEEENLFDLITQGYLTTNIDNNNSYISLVSKTIRFANGQTLNIDTQNRVSINYSFEGDEVSANVVELNRQNKIVKSFSEDFNISGLKIEGNITLEPEYDFGISWTDSWEDAFKGKLVKEVYFNSNLETEGHVKVSYSKNINKTFDKNIGGPLIYEQEFFVFDIPVVTTQVITFGIGAKLKVEGNITVGADAFVNPTLDIGWTENGDAYCDLDPDNGFSYKYWAKMEASTEDFAYFRTSPAAHLYGFGVKIDNLVGPYFEASMDANLIKEGDTLPQSFKDLYSDVNITAGLKGEYGLKYEAHLRADSFKDIFKKVTDWINKKIKDKDYANYKYKLWSKSFEYNYTNAKKQKMEREGYIIVNPDNEYGGFNTKEIVCKMAIENKNIDCNDDSIVSFKIKNEGQQAISWVSWVENKAPNLYNFTYTSDKHGTLANDEEDDVDVSIGMNNLDINLTQEDTGYIKIATINFCKQSPMQITNLLTGETEEQVFFNNDCIQTKESYDIFLSVYSIEAEARKNNMNNLISSLQLANTNIGNKLIVQFNKAGGVGYNPMGYNVYLSELDENGNAIGKNLIGTLPADSNEFNAGNIYSLENSGLISAGSKYKISIVPFEKRQNIRSGKNTIFESNIGENNSLEFEVNIDNDSLYITPISQNAPIAQ